MLLNIVFYNIKPQQGDIMKAKETGFITNGNAWGHPHAAFALCFDGKVRKVRLNQQADSFFSWPGRVTIKGVTVSGYVTGADNGLEFRLNDSSWAKLGLEKM
jgi:hypothetical protein